MDATEVKRMNTTALAYLGDAVYEVAVRGFVMKSGQQHADRLHRLAIKFVCAEGQAKALKAIMPELTEEEQSLVRRARNRRITSKPKHAAPVTYKLSTAFEAFVGYLYLTGDRERMEWFIDRALTVISENGAGYYSEKAESPQQSAGCHR